MGPAPFPCGPLSGCRGPRAALVPRGSLSWGCGPCYGVPSDWSGPPRRGGGRSLLRTALWPCLSGLCGGGGGWQPRPSRVSSPVGEFCRGCHGSPVLWGGKGAAAAQLLPRVPGTAGWRAVCGTLADPACHQGTPASLVTAWEEGGTAWVESPLCGGSPVVPGRCPWGPAATQLAECLPSGVGAWAEPVPLPTALLGDTSGAAGAASPGPLPL